MSATNLLPFDEALKKTPRPFLPRASAMPFVKWAGGKRSLIPYISENLPDEIKTYHEPFVGGGAVFFVLLHLSNAAVLADLNEELVLTYHAVKADVEKVIALLESHAFQHHKDDGYFKRIRKQEPASPNETAARFIYLNKTCYNGLYRVNKKGVFNVPKGSYKNPNVCDKDNLRRVSLALAGVKIKIGEFDRTIKPQEGDFVYCDPPYDGTFTGYQKNGFTAEDQTRLKECVDTWTEESVNVMVSNADTEFIRKLYKDYILKSISVSRSISCKGETRTKADEVLIVNYGQ